MSKLPEELESIHNNATLNKTLLKQSEMCGCFYCLEIFSPKEIEEWVDEADEADGEATAICPRCGIDSLIPSASGIPLTNALLKEMHHRFFINGTIDDEIYAMTRKANLDAFFNGLKICLDVNRRAARERDLYLASQFNVFDHIMLNEPPENRLSAVFEDMLNPEGTHGQGRAWAHWQKGGKKRKVL